MKKNNKNNDLTNGRHRTKTNCSGKHKAEIVKKEREKGVMPKNKSISLKTTD